MKLRKFLFNLFTFELVFYIAAVKNVIQQIQWAFKDPNDYAV